MSVIVSRTCTEVSDTDRNRPNEARPLDDFRSKSAYVLLGDPGAGKTTVFQAESGAFDDAHFISARDFLNSNVDRHPEWHEKTLFIDGLDEVRAGTADARTPLNAIWRQLDALGKPRFRLSCREADWLGTNDRRHLASVSPDGTVTVLSLDPLTDADIVTILEAQSEVNDAQKFIEEAQERGVDELLKNPQSLDLLVKAVADGGWPESRLDTFERACSHIAKERNEEHLIGAQPPALGALLDAAGRLCAVQLIAGIAGYTVGPSASDLAYPSPEECGGDIERDVYKAALATKLFTVESETRLVPVHRHIAEFLGARHLAQLIDGDGGLPIQRVLALITGADGGVVTEMRGLSAWLAAQCPRARMDLIERDPIGVGLYGDLHQFSHDEKHALLNALKRVGGRLNSELSFQDWAAPFGPLATAGMEPALREILTDPARDEQHRMSALFVLRILETGTPLPSLSELLLDIIRDDTRDSRVKVLSLDAFLHNCPDGQDKTSTLKRLLADIRAGQVPDPDNELLGTLLTRLYPQDLPASEVWNYLSESGDSNLIGKYVWFWDRFLLEQSSDEDVCELLDGLPCPPSGLRSALETTELAFEDLPLKLLARGLDAYGDRIPTEQLYDWLGVGLPVTQYKFEEEARNVQVWLEQRPAIQKELLTEGVRRYVESDEESFSGYMYEVEQHLYRANPPSDFGAWCLEQAIAATDSQVAEYFIAFASRKGLPLESQLEKTRGRRDLQTCISRMIARRDRYEAEDQERERQRQSYTEERERRENEWLAYVRRSETALCENRAAPALLHHLAKIYLDKGLFRAMNLNPVQKKMRRQDTEIDDGPGAVKQKLGGDQSLVDATLQGFRGVLARKDVPQVEKIFSLQEENRISYFQWPFLAGLAELERVAPNELDRLDEDQIRKALAFYYCASHGGYRPNWYQRLLDARPEVVADVQVQFAVSEFRRDSASIYNLWELAYDPEHARVARNASLPLLRAFPTRCKLKHINALDHMLWAAIQHADRTSFEELIERKLSQKSMNLAQRMHWLAAGLVVSPAIYRERLSEFVRGREKRIQPVATFFCDPERRLSKSRIPVTLKIPAVEILIRLIGGYVGPELRSEDGWGTPSMEASRLVHTYIQHLATSPAKEASDALASLHADPALERWHGELSRSRDSQRIIRRDAEYRHPDIEQVRSTLRNGPPANVADLAALVTDRLCEIARQIRTDNTNDWRQYWNEDSYGQPQKPKPENSCRDALLSSLRAQLPPSVLVEPERKSAADTRVDISISIADFNVPVEIKKSSHREVWSAMRNQLIEKYVMRDSDASGYGIYLVFWFGPEECQPGPAGRPTSADELEKWLHEALSPAEARRISVCVMDVTKPFDSAPLRSG